MPLLHPSSINGPGEGLYGVFSQCRDAFGHFAANPFLSNPFLLSFASEVERSQAKGICSQCLFKITER